MLHKATYYYWRSIIIVLTAIILGVIFFFKLVDFVTIAYQLSRPHFPDFEAEDYFLMGLMATIIIGSFYAAYAVLKEDKK